MQKWQVVNKKHIKQSQEWTVYVCTALDDECKVVKNISDYRNMVLAAMNEKVAAKNIFLMQATVMLLKFYFSQVDFGFFEHADD